MQSLLTTFDTIAAISTPMGEGAISIVRLSGDKAISIASQVAKIGTKKLTSVASHTIHYGHILDDEKVLDEGMISVFRAPKTFTCEDVVEINCHGGIVVTNQVLQLLLRKGARLAEPGEFTKRAFLNGRIDLAEAEAVMDLIRAKTDQASDLAMKQLGGHLSQLIASLRQEILTVLAEVEVNIDYPEYEDVEEVTISLLLNKTLEIKKQLEQLLQTAKRGKILREGLSTAIIGRPNVGKSSLLNLLLREEKAIVTDIAGTTRDVIEEYVHVQGIPLKLIDTAGIRETTDTVEKIGVERSKKALSESDLVLLVLNGNEKLTPEDSQLIEATNGFKRIVLVNKTDLVQKIDVHQLQKLAPTSKIIPISVLDDKGLQSLEEEIARLFFGGETGESQNATYVSNVRHIGLIESAQRSLSEVLDGIEAQMPIDLLQIDLTRAWEFLGEITGEVVQDELITQLFRQFCLGK